MGLFLLTMMVLVIYMLRSEEDIFQRVVSMIFLGSFMTLYFHMSTTYFYGDSIVTSTATEIALLVSKIF